MASAVFKVIIVARTAEDGQPLYFKVDGQRFADNRTVKACSQSKYEIAITLKPSLGELTRVAWGGIELDIKDSKVQEKSSTYNCIWPTDTYDVTKKGQRSRIPIVLAIESVGKIETAFQCKFYGVSDRTHSRWGDEIKQMEIDCKAPQVGDLVDVVRVTYK